MPAMANAAASSRTAAQCYSISTRQHADACSPAHCAVVPAFFVRATFNFAAGKSTTPAVITRTSAWQTGDVVLTANNYVYSILEHHVAAQKR